MRTLSELLSELGDSKLALFIDGTGNPLLTKQGREMSADWAIGYLTCLKDLGRISDEEYTALAPEPRRLALAAKPKE